MDTRTKVEWGVAIVLLAGIGVGGYFWLQEREARITTEAKTAAQQTTIDALKQQQQQTQQALDKQLQQLEEEKKKPVSAAQFVQDAGTALPDLPKPLEVKTAADAGLPDSPQQEEVVVPQEDLKAIRDAGVSCQEDGAKLSACQAGQADLKKQLDATTAQRDEWATTARGGTWWHRTLSAAKWVAIGAGAGAGAYALTHH